MKQKMLIFAAFLLIMPGAAYCIDAPAKQPIAAAVAQNSPQLVVVQTPTAVPQSAQAPDLVFDGKKTTRFAYALAVFAALVLTYLCCHPVLAFIRRGWGIKKTDIFSSLNRAAKQAYWNNFGFEIPQDIGIRYFERITGHTAAPSPTKNADIDDLFEAMYNHRYGRYRLTVPIILLVIITFTLMLLEALTAVSQLPIENGTGGQSIASIVTITTPIPGLPDPAMAAIAGAYAWVVSSLFDGATRYNLPPQAVLSAALRLVVAVPLGYAVMSISPFGSGPFLAFAFGAFPLAQVQVLLKRITTNKLGLETGPDHLKDQVGKLDGIDPPTADRLADGDILTIAQLAYCDPVQISMRTNLSFNAVIVAQSQAIAWVYLDDNAHQLAGIGLRGAIEIRKFCDDLEAETDPDGSSHQLLQTASLRTATAPDQTARPAIPPAGLRNAFAVIAQDPFTQFLVEVWNSTGQGPDTAPALALVKAA